MECKVKFVDEKLRDTFQSLKNSDERLYKEISKAFNDICQNAFVLNVINNGNYINTKAY